MENAFEAAVETGVSQVSTNYAHHLHDYHGPALECGIAILPECGLDPGIDLVIYGEGVEHFDEVHRLDSFCGGIPEPGACDNPLNYKISRNFEAVLRSRMRDSVFIRNRKHVFLPAADQHRSDFTHEIDYDRWGRLEAVPSGDAVFYTDLLGITDQIRNTGRYSLRWPGWCALWNPLKELGFFSAAPLDMEDCSVVPARFLARLLTPRLHYKEYQKDIVVMRNRFAGIKNGKTVSRTYDLTIERDLETGLYAMSKGVGFTVSIAA